jgi:ribosome-associated protein
MSQDGGMADAVDVPIRDESIRLGQFLKLANLIESGAEAKSFIADGVVSVNGEVDLRRGRQLHQGDIVSIEGGPSARVVNGGGW